MNKTDKHTLIWQGGYDSSINKIYAYVNKSVK